MSNLTCCVVNCKNNGRNSKCLFFSFPTSAAKAKQRASWIAAVKRKNADGSPWMPKPHDRICSVHFVGNDKSTDERSPSYSPTIFPAVYHAKRVNEKVAAGRYNRLVTRNFKQGMKLAKPPLKNQDHVDPAVSNQNNEDVIGNSQESDSIHMICDNMEKMMIDQGCQVETYDLNEPQKPSNSFFIYRSDQGSNLHNVEIQTDIIINTREIHVTKKRTKDKKCGTAQIQTSDQSVGPDSGSAGENNPDLGFLGIESLKKEEQFLDLAGVSSATFKLLLSRTEHLKGDNWKVKRKNRLLIFLMKLKTGLTFSALSALFSVDRTTVSRIFHQMLQHLVCATQEFIFWPSKVLVQDTMPKCFKDKYGNTRVIIDCTEFRMEIPSNLDDRVWCYSNYKHGFTIKILVCITPGGFICFKSKAAGGRKSDSQITIESGLLDLLEEGDIVLADKGFPEIKTVIDASGKKVIVVMPPFLSNKKEFTKEETEETYNIASVRIHVERIMQRLRVYKILDKIPRSLFKYMDDIIHMCCVLVNLQPPIFAEENSDNTEDND